MLYYYPYASFDFLLGEDGLYFIEANAVSAGLYYTEMLAKHVARRRPDLRDNLIGLTIMEDFIELCSNYHLWLTEKRLRTLGISVPDNWKSYLGIERIELKQTAEKMGFKAVFIRKKSSAIIGSTLVSFEEGGEVIPDLVVRRTFKFPIGIKQPVINPSEAGIVTGSKWRTYKAVKEVTKMIPELKQPETHLVKSFDELEEASSSIISRGKEVVIKPSNEFGGRGITIIRNFNDLKILRNNIDFTKPYVVQERVRTYPIRFEDGKVYPFDMRVYALNGRIAGAQIRRSSSEDKIVTNISAGGHLAPLLLDGDDIESVPIGRTEFRFPNRVIIVDGVGVILDRRTSELLRRASMLISSEIEKAVREKVLAKKAEGVHEKSSSHDYSNIVDQLQ
jgi:glutathione synthase/RimK-type ligase-like ATP-grasp enzyme